MLQHACCMRTVQALCGSQEKKTCCRHAPRAALQAARLAAKQQPPPAPELPQALAPTPSAELLAAPPAKAPAAERADAKEEGSPFSALVRTRIGSTPCLLHLLCRLG